MLQSMESQRVRHNSDWTTVTKIKNLLLLENVNSMRDKNAIAFHHLFDEATFNNFNYEICNSSTSVYKQTKTLCTPTYSKQPCIWKHITISFALVQSPNCIWLLCDSMDCSPPGSTFHWISQARILEWVAVSFFRGLFHIRNQICISINGR